MYGEAVVFLRVDSLEGLFFWVWEVPFLPCKGNGFVKDWCCFKVF